MMPPSHTRKGLILSLALYLGAGCGVEPQGEDEASAIARATATLAEWGLDWRALPSEPSLPQFGEPLSRRSEEAGTAYWIEDALAVRRVEGGLLVQTSACAPASPPSPNQPPEATIALTLPLRMDDPGQFRIRLPICVRAIDFDGHALLAVVEASKLERLRSGDGTILRDDLYKESLLVVALNREGGKGAHVHKLALTAWPAAKTILEIKGAPDYLVGETYDTEFGIADDRAFCRLESRGRIGRANSPTLVISTPPARSIRDVSCCLVLGSASRKAFTMLEIGTPSFAGCRIDDPEPKDLLHEARDAFSAERYEEALSLFAKCEGLSSWDDAARNVARIRAKGDGDWTAIERAHSSSRYCDTLFFLRLEYLLKEKDWHGLESFCKPFAGDTDFDTHARFLRGFARTLHDAAARKSCLNALGLSE